MATLTNNSTGDFTTAATWSLVNSVSLSDSETSSSNITTSFQSSASFTPGAITIDGIGVKVLSRSATPSGTFSVRLFNVSLTAAVAGTTVTVNVSDLPESVSGWVFFKFSSPVLLLAATAYNVQVMSSISTQVQVYRTSTAADWSRYLRTTTTQAPVAADVLFVCGEYTGVGANSSLTVTMNNTASTVFGKLEASGLGILSYGTAASTNYQLICEGNVLSNGGGSIRIGTSGTRIPSTSTALLQINQAGVNVNYTFSNRASGDLQSWGNNKTWRTVLSADSAVSATSLTSSVSTGWSTGEDIVIASTTRTNSETELRTLAVNASGTTITVPALSFAHSGTSPTQAELANITRNVKIKGESLTLGSYMQASTNGTIDFNDTEFQYFGSATVNKRGFDFFPVSTSVGIVNIKDCAFKNWETTSTLFLLNQALNDRITIDGCVFYRMSGSAITTGAITTTGITITNCWAFSNVAAGNVHYNIAMQGGIFTNNRAISATNNGFSFSGTDNTGMTCDSLVSHSNGATGITIAATSSSNSYFPLTNITTWRNTTRGIFFSGASRVALDTGSSFGNVTSGIELSNSYLIQISNMAINGGTTLVQPIGMNFTSSTSDVTVDSCSFGTLTTHTTSSVSISTNRQWHNTVYRNCNFGDSTEVSSQNNLTVNAQLGSSKHDQTNSIHKMWKSYGTITADSSITANAPLSVRSTPTSATYKLKNERRTVAVPSGKAVQIQVSVRKSVAGDGTAYNGNFPRLIVKENTAAGITTDTVLATATAASVGAFEVISGTTVVTTGNTILTFYIDLDGTTGWVNSDNWRVQILNGSTNSLNITDELYWADGKSRQGINTLYANNSGTETYWENGRPAIDLYPISNAQTGRFFLDFE